MDYCPGGDLSLHLAEKGLFSEDEAKFFMAELVLAIEHVHELDIIYRDLKPENILIGSPKISSLTFIGEDGHIRLADFGLSKQGVGDEDRTKSFCGSPAYLAPEMLRNKGVGKAADIYGIGAVLYELLEGVTPFFDEDVQMMYQNIRKG